MNYNKILNDNKEELKYDQIETCQLNLIGKVTGCKKLNVREKPSLDSKVLTILSSNDEVFAVDKESLSRIQENPNIRRNDEDKDWIPVLLDEDTLGYVMAEYLALRTE